MFYYNQTFFFFLDIVTNPNCIYHHETGERWVVHIELWFLEEGCWIDAATSLHLVFPHLVCASGKT